MITGKEKTISQSLQAGTAAWGVDYDILLKARSELVDYVGIQVKETGDLYIGSLKDFYEAPTRTIKSGRRTTLQRVVFVSQLLYSTGKSPVIK